MIAAAPLSGPPRGTRVRSFAALRAVICGRGAFEVTLIQAERPPDVSGVFPFVVQRKGKQRSFGEGAFANRLIR
jgi:hypothetical protein